jgi:serine/threonine protein kinase
LAKCVSRDKKLGQMAEKSSTAVADVPMQRVRFGNFEVVNDPEGRPLALGKGTFGRTYQARHRFLDTIVALKIITERYATDAAVRQRFLIEARAVAKLSHPHVARLYDFGEMDGVLHYAMEYCGGGSLADYVAKHGALELRQVLEVAQQIAGALKCAHAAGFIHRDLKPSNIMLTSEKPPLFAKLIDFGLVQPSIPGATRSVSDDQSADGARFLGTPLFASPEQLREEPMDIRTDLFSFGMTLWYLIIGGPPETGSSAAIAASRLSSESYSGRLPGNIPPQFRDVLSKLLEKDRTKRFASAGDLFAALNLCAASLGFRRARDYTDARPELGEWEDEEPGAPAGPQATTATPIEVQKVDAELSSEFSIIARINEDFTGLNYVGASAGNTDAGVILHVLHPVVLENEDAFNRLRGHLGQLITLDVAEIVRPTALKNYSDYTAIILEKPGGTDLMSVLRTERTVQLIEAAPLLENIADACDALSAAGLPGVQLAPGRVFVEWETENVADNRLRNARAKLYPRFLAVSEAPELARMNEPEDVSSTMTTDMLSDPSRADNMPEHFGTLVYRVVAGRNCPMAAALSSQAYVAIPGLSEHSNRLLSLVIAKQIAINSCGQILREILGAEGIVPRVANHPSAGFTARTGSTVTPPDVAPVNRLAQISTPTPAPPLGKRETAPRAWQPPTVTPYPATPPPLPRSPVATPSPTVVPQATPPPISPPVETRAPEPVEARAPEPVEIPTPEPVETRAPEPVEIRTPEPVEARAPEPVVPSAPAPAAEEPVKEEQVIPPSPPPEAKVSRTKSRRKKAREPVEEPTAVTETPKRDRVPEPETIASAPSAESSLPMPVILPQAPITKVPRPEPEEEETQRFRYEALWQNRKIRGIGIGIAALLVVSLSFAVVKKFGRTTPSPQPVVAARTEKPPAAIVEKPAPSAPPIPHIAAGRYVGRLSMASVARNRRTTVNGATDVEREISIDPRSATGDLIEYGDDLTRHIPLAEGRLDPQGVYTARAMFSSATRGAHNDETLAVNSGKNNSVEVKFQGRQISGEQYTLSGALHPWSSDDQAQYERLVADRAAAAAAAEQKRKLEEARMLAEQQAAAQMKMPQLPPPEQPKSNEQREAASARSTSHHRQSTGSDSAKATGASTHQASASQRSAGPPPPPQPAAAPKAAPRTAPKGEAQPRRSHEFEGSAPGG